MCGIAGLVNLNNAPADETVVNQLLRLMKHRGPDDEGVFVENNICLGHVRLSILDLSSAGHQPMFSTCGRYVLIFNGEIYNYRELRVELASTYEFRTQTDTEVILAAYLHWGKDCLNHFNGMWAFAIYDRQSRTLFAARDRFGIKPFYYYQDEELLLFASEPAALAEILKSIYNKFQGVNRRAVFDYLVSRRTHHTKETFFAGIKRLKQGHILTVSENNVQISCWYKLEEHVNKRALSHQELAETFCSGVELRLRSDVPVGISLSGGMDSGAITGMVVKGLQLSGYQTFSAVYQSGQRGDETEYIELYRDYIDKMHYVSPNCDSFLEDIQRFIETQQEPVPTTSPYADFRVVELASKNITVILSGQGGDEVFAGYDSFYSFYYKELLLQGQWGLLAREFGAYFRQYRDLKPLVNLAYYLSPDRLKNSIKHITKPYVNADFLQEFNADNAAVHHLWGSKSVLNARIRFLEDSFQHYLMWGDRNQMRFSLEGRYPFLDNRLVESALGLPSHQLVRDGIRRYLFKKAVRDVVPPTIIQRKDKMGYETPESEWFRSEAFTNFFTEITESQKFRERGYLSQKEVKRMFTRHSKGEVNASQYIWQVLNNELWHRRFIDG
ncbi:MAG: asparagine synthase (glutamine-hydrolyzing) [Candidatus Cloacimonetes bacterium]|nr:asparagine synthase (glutamine-hydrolyzing) [Candidatus Cloacimonadota bacterium]